MTNKIAIILGLLIILLITLNFLLGWDAQIALGRKFIDLVEYLAFWR